MKSSSSTNNLSDRNFDKLSIPVSYLESARKQRKNNTTDRNRGVTFKLLNRRGGKVGQKPLSFLNVYLYLNTRKSQEMRSEKSVTHLLNVFWKVRDARTVMKTCFLL